MMTHGFAIIDSNALSCMGLRRLLEDIVPSVPITVFNSYEELIINEPERFVHFFVSSGIYFEHAQFFLAQQRRSIVLVNGDAFPHVKGLLTINVCQPEAALIKSILLLQRHGHQGMSMPPVESEEPLLTSREVEVAVLLAKGFINKEIAETLSISLNTVITHRKNIMTKLQARSLTDVIMYVVMNRYVSLEDL